MTDTPEKKAHIIVVSNEKGGTGKSTIAMHLAVKLMQEGFSVATIDLDGRQGSLSKYIENRKSFCEQKKIALPIPLHYRFEPESNAYLIPGEREKIGFQIYELSRQVDAVIIDTPGTKNYLFEEAHKYADTVITPITDSLIDLNVIADIDFATGKVARSRTLCKLYLGSQKVSCRSGETLSQLDCCRQPRSHPPAPATRHRFLNILKNSPNFTVIGFAKA